MSKFQLNRLLTADEVEVRVWAIVVIIVTVILAGIVMFMLYSLAFVTQPIKSMAPMDQAFAKMLNDIVLLIVGGIGGVMSKKGVQSLSENIASKPTPTSVAAPVATPTPTVSTPTPQPSMFGFDFGGFKNPELDEAWRAPPPPTTPPNHEHPEREEIANERAAARLESV